MQWYKPWGLIFVQIALAYLEFVDAKQLACEVAKLG
jgi:hypothetical protein